MKSTKCFDKTTSSPFVPFVFFVLFVFFVVEKEDLESAPAVLY
jgi:hypothetical protein